jgi:hypothetical protein
MVLSTHDPILAHRLAHTARLLVHISARPASLPMALHHPRSSGSGANQQQELACGPLRRPGCAVAPTARACMRVVSVCTRAVWPLA